MMSCHTLKTEKASNKKELHNMKILVDKLISLILSTQGYDTFSLESIYNNYTLTTYTTSTSYYILLLTKILYSITIVQRPLHKANSCIHHR